jgi:hypothetical protein
MRGRFAILFLVIFNFGAPNLRAGDKQPTPADVRLAVERSLPFIEKEGLAWIKRRDCMSCHVVPFMLWSHNEAQARGMNVDAKKLAEWTDWSMGKSLEQRNFFKLPGKVVESLPEPLRPKLTDLIDVGYTHEKDYVAALTQALTAEELKQHQPALVKHAALPKKGTVNDGGSVETMAQLLLGRDPSIRTKTMVDFNAGTAELIARWQETDGTWKAGGQLPSRRWPRAIADQTTTMWTLLALAPTQQADPTLPMGKEVESHIVKGVKKMREALKQSKPGENHEWLVARLLFENRFGGGPSIKPIRAELLKRQNDDGGWGVFPGQKSEAFSTGGMGAGIPKSAGANRSSSGSGAGLKWAARLQIGSVAFVPTSRRAQERSERSLAIMDDSFLRSADGFSAGRAWVAPKGGTGEIGGVVHAPKPC